MLICAPVGGGGSDLVTGDRCVGAGHPCQTVLPGPGNRVHLCCQRGFGVRVTGSGNAQVLASASRFVHMPRSIIQRPRFAWQGMASTTPGRLTSLPVGSMTQSVCRGQAREGLRLAVLPSEVFTYCLACADYPWKCTRPVGVV